MRTDDETRQTLYAELASVRRRFAAIASWVLIVLLPFGEAAAQAGGLVWQSAAVSAAQLLASIAVLLLLERHAEAAFRFMITAMALTTLLRAAVDGGVGTASYFSYGLLVVVASLLLGARGGALTAMVGVSGGGLLFFAYSTGKLEAPHSPTPEQDFAISVGMFVGAALLIGYFGRAFTETLERRADAEREAEEARERYSMAAWGARSGAWEWVPETDQLWLSPEVRPLRGLPAGEVLTTGAEWLALVHEDDRSAVRRDLEERTEGGPGPRRVQYRLLGADGGWIWVESQHQLIPEGPARPRRVIGALRDVTEPRRIEEALHRQAFYDSLTSLPNRSLFLDRLGQSIRRARRRGTPDYAVLFVDLDRFKIVNDSLGHAVGDQLLVEFAARLRAAVRDVDTAARLGGDEFAVLLDQVDKARVDLVTERIRGLVDAPFELADRKLFVGASIGVLRGSLDYTDPLEAIRDADLAMYSAKEGAESVGYFRPAMRAQAEHLLTLDSDLRAALEAGTLEPWYQPIVDLRDGRLRGFEALVRWHKPGHTEVVLPREFVPRAEETGLIVEIDQRMLRAATRAVAAWNRERETPLTLNVNLSAWTFQADDLLDHIEQSLRESGLDADALLIELTERVLLGDLPRVRERLAELRAVGVGVAVDDFGTGYSSLGFLHRLRPQCLKIDRGFVQERGASGPGPICRAIQSMAGSLGLEVIAEGIETEAQRASLVGLGCHVGQGWLFGRAVDAEAAGLLASPDVGRVEW